jgi:hypothetical protein
MGKKSSASTLIVPTDAAPTLYQSVTPLESFEDVAAVMRRAQEETAKIQQQRYREVGTPAEIGARQAGRRVQEEASYLASLPQGDRFLREARGGGDPFGAARGAAETGLTEAQKEYAKALERAGELPEPTISPTPSWAQRTVT